MGAKSRSVAVATFVLLFDYTRVSTANMLKIVASDGGGLGADAAVILKAFLRIFWSKFVKNVFSL